MVNITKGRPFKLSRIISMWIMQFIRQRKILNPAFSAAAVRNLTSVFQDAAHKVSHSSFVRQCVRNRSQAVIAWDTEIEANRGTDCAVVDVQQWYLFSLQKFPSRALRYIL